MNSNLANGIAPLQPTSSQVELATEATDSFTDHASTSLHLNRTTSRSIVHSASASLPRRRIPIPEHDIADIASPSAGPSPQASRRNSASDLASPPSAWTSTIAINSGGGRSAESVLHYLRRSYLNCVILDVQAGSPSDHRARPAILGAVLKRDFFQHRAFRWFSISKGHGSSSSSATTASKKAQLTHDVVFLTSGVVERINQLPQRPVVIAYDENGDRDDAAGRLVRTLKTVDKDVMACYLRGGISSFVQRFPYFTDPRPDACQLVPDLSAPDAPEGPRLRRYQAAILSGNDVEPSLILTRDWTAISKSKARFPLGATSASPPWFVVSPLPTPSESSVSMASSAAAPNPPSEGVSAEQLAVPTASPSSSASTATSDDNIPEPTSNAPFLFLSGMNGAAERYITQHKITHVLNVTHHQHMSSFNHVEYLRIAIDDAPKVNIAEFFDVATAFIDSARKRPDGRILVHCYAGVSRSVSMVLAYLIRFHECTLLQAFDVVYRNRPVAQPNEGFARKLQKYEMACRKTTHPSVAYGWLSASNTAYLDFIEFVEGYDELHRRAVFRHHPNASIVPSAVGSNSSISNVSATSPGSSINTLESPSSPAVTPGQSNRRYSAGTSVTGSVEQALTPVSTGKSRSRSGSVDHGTLAAAAVSSTKQTKTRMILAGMYNASQSKRRNRGPTM